MDGGSRRILPDSRPLALYTQNPRPFAISHANGRGRPQDNYLIPVHRPCIHKIPVHPPFLMPMDGGGRRTTTRFPSTGLVYTEPPSIHRFPCLWTGAAARQLHDSRPLTLYTRIPRPFALYAVYPHHIILTFLLQSRTLNCKFQLNTSNFQVD